MRQKRGRQQALIQEVWAAIHSRLLKSYIPISRVELVILRFRSASAADTLESLQPIRRHACILSDGTKRKKCQDAPFSHIGDVPWPIYKVAGGSADLQGVTMKTSNRGILIVI